MSNHTILRKLKKLEKTFTAGKGERYVLEMKFWDGSSYWLMEGDSEDVRNSCYIRDLTETEALALVTKS